MKVSLSWHCHYQIGWIKTPAVPLMPPSSAFLLSLIWVVSTAASEYSPHTTTLQAKNSVPVSSLSVWGISRATRCHLTHSGKTEALERVGLAPLTLFCMQVPSKEIKPWTHFAWVWPPPSTSHASLAAELLKKFSLRLLITIAFYKRKKYCLSKIILLCIRESSQVQAHGTHRKTWDFGNEKAIRATVFKDLFSMVCCGSYHNTCMIFMESR